MLNIILELLSSFLIRLSPDRIKRIGRTTGRIMWHILPSRRRIATRAIELHLDQGPQQAKDLAKRSFLESGKAFSELFLGRRLDYRLFQGLVEVEDAQYLRQTLETPRPIVFVTAHFGAWELLAGVSVLVANGRPCQIVVRHPKSRPLTQLLSHLRKYAGNEIVHKQQAASTILQGLKNNGLTAFLVDQNCGRSKAVFLPFLKQTAAVNKGPALLAIRARALVVPIFLIRQQSGFYRLRTLPLLDTRSLKCGKEEKIRTVAAFYTRAVEEMVQQHPEQWFWMHRRWKTRPKGEGKEQGAGLE